MGRFLVTALLVAAVSQAVPAQAQQNLGSSNYMLPLCKTWLKIAVDRDFEELRSVLRTEPIRLTTAGMCAGMVIGISEALRSLELSCPPSGVTNDQLVRIAIREIDFRVIGSGKMGPVTRAIQGAFQAAVRGRNARSSGWLTRVEPATVV